jgi:hypothetical protein
MSDLSNSGYAVFPLSLSHYFETLKHLRPERRQRLAMVMRSLSQGHTVAALSNITRYEVRSALISMLNLNNKKEEFQYLGKDFSFALGKNCNLKLDWPKPELVPKDFRNKLEDYCYSFQENFFLSGVLKPGEIEHLLSKIDLTPDNKFKDHVEEWKGCASLMSKAELRRKIYSIALKDMLIPICEQLIDLSVPTERFSALGEENIFRLLDLMPTIKVDMHLREQWAKNGSLIPKQSDLNDWNYIGSAISYSDFVITEKQMADLLSRSEVYASKVTSNLSDVLGLKIA